MNEEMRAEAIEMSITACEKYAPNYEVSYELQENDTIDSNYRFCPYCLFQQVAAKTIKETMDKKFGSYWHVVVGEGFGFEVSYETKHILYLFFGGNLAIVLWKCS